MLCWVHSKGFSEAVRRVQLAMEDMASERDVILSGRVRGHALGVLLPKIWKLFHIAQFSFTSSLDFIPHLSTTLVLVEQD